jgi:hypothetical protein
MQKLMWYVRLVRRYVTWPGLLAGGLLAVSIAGYGLHVLPMDAERKIFAAEMALLRQATPVANADEVSLTPAEQLATFYAFFPKDDAQSDVLDNIFAAAAKENLALPQGEYQWTRENTGKLIRYGITLPLKGPYPGVRRFMAQALKENPSLVLDSVNFGRQSVTDIGVDAQLHFTLLLRGEAQ